MKRSTIITLVAAVMLPSVSCVQTNTTRPETIALVKQIAADSTGQRSLIASFPSDADGVVTIAGETAGVRSVMNRMLVSDVFDNIDASLNPDGLPDFAGETFCGVADTDNDSYPALFEAGGEAAVREAVVRSVMHALDTPDSPASKLIVLTSPMSSAYGAFDVDTLFKMAGTRPRFIEPVSAIMDAVGSGKNVLIATSAPMTAFYEAAPCKSSVHAFSSSETLSADYLREVLVQYRDAGLKAPVNVIVSDSYSHTTEALKSAIEFLRSGIFPEDTALSALVATDCRIIDISSALVRECYLKMREYNIFTHNISYPVARSFGFVIEDVSD